MNLEPLNQISIELLTHTSSDEHFPALIEILQDSINSGASIGYLPPFPDSDARDYWTGVLKKVANGSVLLWVARDVDLGVVGKVQLELANKTNALHRSEVCKLLVHQKARRRSSLDARIIAGDLSSHKFIMNNLNNDLV